jgi:hypothetical protein
MGFQHTDVLAARRGTTTTSGGTYLQHLGCAQCLYTYGWMSFVCVCGGGSVNPSIFSIFSYYSFWVHQPVNRDVQHLLAHAMASDFSVAWQFLSKRTIGFSLRIKLIHKKWKSPDRHHINAILKLTLLRRRSRRCRWHRTASSRPGTRSWWRGWADWLCAHAFRTTFEHIPIEKTSFAENGKGNFLPR